MNAEYENDFLCHLATNHPHCEKNLTKRHAAFTFESVHVRSLQICEYFIVDITSTISIMILHALSHRMIFAVLDV